MNKLTTIKVSAIVLGLALPFSALSLASAATTSTTTVPGSVFRTERLDAVAKVLNTTTANVQAARKNHTVKDLVSKAGLTKQSFHQKVRAQITSDLEAKGYSQAEIKVAFKHRNYIHAKRAAAKS